MALLRNAAVLKDIGENLVLEKLAHALKGLVVVAAAAAAVVVVGNNDDEDEDDVEKDEKELVSDRR